MKDLQISYGAIMKTDEEQVQLMKRRGGVGHDLSHIRPKDSLVKNSALTSTGIVPFMERYSNSTREVAQEGRRGALMLSISIQHPDAEHFIGAKLEAGKVTGANISVKITDEFMEAVVSDGEYTPAIFPSKCPTLRSPGKSTPGNSGEKSSTTHGNRLNRDPFLGYHPAGIGPGLLFRPRLQKPYPQTPAARSRYVLTTAAASLLSTFTVM